jgi:hypothetical protein
VRILPIFFVALFLFSSVKTYADRHGGGHVAPDASPTKKQNKILGQCTVIAGNGNMIGGPCANLVLTLSGGSDSEVLYTRTSTDGAFEFSVSGDGKYKVGVNSRFYEVVSPVENIQGGQNIILKLRQKL